MYGGKQREIKFAYKGDSIKAALNCLPTVKIFNKEEGKYTIFVEIFGKGIDIRIRSR